ncbi:MAG: tRNA pseudouridine(55) synthase TruB [Bacteroidetes bacterium]|nr:tRNA pseudouridine(55) synthase TruB [Bacteroidota bacterium]
MGLQFEQGEILLINKPYKWTSFDVVAKLRSLIRTYQHIKKIKIGHAGTLDPLATGLLIICTGKFTKRIDEFQGLEKEYTGVFRLGSTTPSFDLETQTDKELPFEHITAEQIMQAVKQLSGSYDQTPPVFSAKKIGGRRAYQYARLDQEVEISPNHVTVSGFELTQVNLPYLCFRISCSKGTYIRSIARDLGVLLGCGAHLTELCRTRIGSFSLRDAWEMENISQSLFFNGDVTDL